VLDNLDNLENLKRQEDDLEETRLHLEKALKCLDQILDSTLGRIKSLHETMDLMAKDHIAQENREMLQEEQLQTINQSITQALTLIHAKRDEADD
jgi:hypothetical protein